MKKTLVCTARKQYFDAQEATKDYLQLDDLTHNTHLYECGLKFLKQIGLHEEQREFKALIRNKAFWNWYRSEWCFAQRDWLRNTVKLKNLTLPAARALYNANMEMKCIEGRQITVSFDSWIQ